MDSAKIQLVEKLQSATNILVTVSHNPSVDQLTACIGLTLLLNKFGKHATAVFSGKIPSTLEFLQPEQTLEKNTDSLRDFIIALDKSKADKLRYKVEDEMVRIFITPYRVSISDKDLEFSQGDFNVDVVIALGVSRQEDFDVAITAHGRILHDAVVSSISTTSGDDLGSINWFESDVSSLSEIVVGLAHALGGSLLDAQISTALLTGIVSETDRFSNEKTTPQTMNISAELMAAGANQQLVATKLDVTESEPAERVAIEPVAAAQSPEGTLEINHETIDAVLDDLAASETELQPEQFMTTEAPVLVSQTPVELPAPVEELTFNKSSRLIVEPPSLGGALTANSDPENMDYSNDLLGTSSVPPQPLLNRQRAPAPQPPTLPTFTPTTPYEQPTPPEPIWPAAPVPPAAPKFEPLLTGFTPPPPAWVPATQDATNQLNDPTPPATVYADRTLAEIEADVRSSHIETLDVARDEVTRALNSQPSSPEPVQALGAHPLGEPLHEFDTPSASPMTVPPLAFNDILNQVIPPAPSVAPAPLPAPTPTVTDPSAPPPVPPPMPFNFGTPTPPPQQ